MFKLIRRISKNWNKKIYTFGLTLALMFTLSPQIIAQPPPPGVPIDAGASVLIIAAVSYGAKKMMEEKEVL
jgi:hypothetical protein